MIGTVAAMCDGKLLAEKELDPSQRSAQSLAPGLKSLLEEVAWLPSHVELVAVTAGPGSFTGLRVGMATAKVFAYAAGAEILGIDTLQAIARRAPEDIEGLSVAVDAQRGEVVARSFRRATDGWFEPVDRAGLVDADTWLTGLPPGTILSGPVLRKLADRVPNRVTMLDPQYWSPKAADVAGLAARDYAAGRRDDIYRLAPFYSRRSAAEEKWEVDSG